LTVEIELTGVIYALYLIDCIHWLKPGEAALTRRWRGKWKRRSVQDDSYTLLGRMPVLVNPVDLRPSFISGSETEIDRFERSIADVVSQRAPDSVIISVLTFLGAVNLLIIVPASLVSGYFEVLWRGSASIALFVQVFLAIEIYEQCAVWRVYRRGDFWQQFVSLTLNPLAALRSGDVLLKGLYITDRTQHL